MENMKERIEHVVDTNIYSIEFNNNKDERCLSELKRYYKMHGKYMKQCKEAILKEDTTEELKTKALCQIELSRMTRKLINIALKRELTQEEIESFRQKGYDLYHKYYERI